MPYPESCPECGSTFRNTGTHFTARRHEVGRHVLLELGCQNTSGRFWWDFTTGNVTEDGRPTTARRTPLAETVGAGSANNGALHAESNGHARVSTLELPKELGSMASIPDLPADFDRRSAGTDVSDGRDSRAPSLDIPEDLQGGPVVDAPTPSVEPEPQSEPELEQEPQVVAPSGLGPGASGSLKDAFLRQLQLDRLTLRQMRSWLMSEEARRAIEVAAGATEATYERLALILFGSELPQLLGKPSAAPQNSGISAEDRLELQREKARIRARLRRAAAKAAKTSD